MTHGSSAAGLLLFGFPAARRNVEDQAEDAVEVEVEVGGAPPARGQGQEGEEVGPGLGREEEQR